MKFLIFGASGMAGHTISLYLSEQGHEVVGFSRSNINYFNSIIGDVHNLDEVRNILKTGDFDVVVNCIGILNFSAENSKHEAVFLNSFFPHLLVEATKDTRTIVIQMSTDCVFSGKKGSYTEKMFQDGPTFYDRTKALGEIVDNKNITFRNSIIGPDMNSNGIGLLNWFMLQKREVNGYKNVMWTGITTLELAKAIEAAAVQKVFGLFNLVNDLSISKYNILVLLNKHLRGGELVINSIENIKSDKSLKRLNFDFDFIVSDYETMIVELGIWMKSHHYLYPHYNLES